MSKRWLSGGGLLLALVLLVAVNIIANATLTSWRLDLTENRLYTLSDGTKRILGNLKEPVTLRFYYTGKSFSDIPALANYGTRVRDMLEEYVAYANGNIKLTIVEPEPFSEAEDEAVGYGIRQVQVSNEGETGYFGLVGTNTTDDEATIPLFQPGKEASLEYELTKMIYNLAHPKKRVLGIISSLPIFGDESRAPPGTTEAGAWAFLPLVKEAYETRMIRNDAAQIDEDIDTLVIIHPKDLGDRNLYAIDQFVLHGGKAMVFVDPMAEQDPAEPDPASPLLLPKHDSNLERLFQKWGIKMQSEKVVGDIDSAIRVQYTGRRGPQEIEYLPWLRLTTANFNQDDFVTDELQVVHVGSAGALERLEGAKTELTPLISTSPNSMLLERDAVTFQRDPAGLLDLFKPGNKALVIAARVRGPAETAFPQGKPKSDNDKADDPNFVKEAKEPINVIVVADTDLLADRFWVHTQNFLGQRIPQVFADNVNFLMNALDNLGGNQDLISLRSRAKYARPFDRVESIREDAERKFRERERALQTRLEETEKKLKELQQSEGSSEVLLSAEQRAEIDKFRDDQVSTRKELRAVQHDLQKDIERLGTQLKFINIGLIPVLIGLLAIGWGIYRHTRPASR